MMYNVYKKGFTLIELLVVIAIIGILAGIVLASLGSARSGANDAKVQEQLKSIQNAAEIYYSRTQNYGADVTCSAMAGDTTSGMSALTAATAWPGGAAPTFQCKADGSEYLVYHPLSSASADAWCVDSGGASQKVTGYATAIGGTATQCP